MNAQLLGIHTAVPEHRMSQSEALQLAKDIVCRDARDERFVRVLYRKASVENRHTAVPYTLAYEWTDPRGPTTGERMQIYAEHAPPLALDACRGALANSGVTADEITHLVTVSCTGFSAPGVDIALLQSLPLRCTVQRVHVGYMGCHGAVNGLRVAQAFTNQPEARVLMVAVELCSLHYRFDWDDEAIVGNSLFGDGAAAVVLQAAPFRAPHPPAHNSASNNIEIAATASCLLPDSTQAMSWKVGDFGFEMRLTQGVPAAIQNHLRSWLDVWLREAGIGIDGVAQWLVHPGGPKILEAVEKALELNPDQTEVSRRVLQQYGNMSSPTLLFILERTLQNRLPRPAVMLAFGPGLIAEAALVV